MAIASNLGFPRIGAHRELKSALESYWAGKSDEPSLLTTGQDLRRKHWLLQKQLGVQHIPSNDFSFYDHVLDAACIVGAVPERYKPSDQSVSVRTYFAMARGSQGKGSLDAPAMEMTKWFDTNYHYIVPEFASGRHFHLASMKPIDEFLEARSLGIQTRPVLLGPISFLLLGKMESGGAQRLSFLDSLLPIYEEVLKRLQEAGAEWVQFDEPFLALDLTPEARTAFSSSYARLRRNCGGLHLLVATYFAALRENIDCALHLPISALHIDLVRAPEQLEQALSRAPRDLTLSLGVIDGRNVWRTDLQRALGMIERAANTIGPERLMIGPSCSLLHSPIDINLETRIDDELRNWLAFAKQKLEEVVLLTRAINEGVDAIRESLDASQEARERRHTSTRIRNEGVRRRSALVNAEMLHRQNPYPVRNKIQKESLRLPLLPTTTIGSFPQTSQIRTARAEFRAGKRSLSEYEALIRTEIKDAIRLQESLGLDVLVHGEFERTDMVEFFGEQLAGVATTEHGWVQSYGSRCVRPPIIFGDIARRKPITVEWTRFAQSLTAKPVKGMLTGPVTILQWSFVRDDQPREDTCRQIALAIREEACDLESTGIRVIQIDEPAFREGLPLRRSDWRRYLQWAVETFRLASSGVRDGTQIHTHMCYSEFNDIIEEVAEMDADVLSIETARSRMELLGAFKRFHYPNEIGPGVYDIHSPRVPGHEEIEDLLQKALRTFTPSQLWVNPDCGLKTRRWDEVRPALAAMVDVAKKIRRTYEERAAAKH